MNKLNSFIRDANNYINYNDLILDYIYKKRNLKLAENIFPLVEDKTLLTRFIQILNLCKIEEETEWIKVIFENGFSEANEMCEISQIDMSAFDNISLKYSSKNGLIEIVKYLIKNGADIHTENDFSIILASENGHFEIVKYLVENGAETALAPRDRRSHIHADDDYSLRYASENGH